MIIENKSEKNIGTPLCERPAGTDGSSLGFQAVSADKKQSIGEEELCRRVLTAIFGTVDFNRQYGIEYSQALAETVGRLLASLTNREQQILHGLMADGKTTEEVAEDFQTTRERIRQIEAKALRKLRHPSRVEQLRPFFTKQN